MDEWMVDPREIYIDGTHIKANANKKKYQKEQVKKAAKVYEEQLRLEVNAEREALGKSPIEDDEEDDPHGGMVTKTVSTTDPDAGMFVKGDHEKQFAYEAHTACDRHGMVLGVEVTAGNIHDSSTPGICRNCPSREACGANEKGQKQLTRHICPSI